jgi:isocitrate dehydrogenase
MLRYLGWTAAADAIDAALERAIQQKRVTYDFERQMEGATLVSTSGFASAIIESLQA